MASAAPATRARSARIVPRGMIPATTPCGSRKVSACSRRGRGSCRRGSCPPRRRRIRNERMVAVDIRPRFCCTGLPVSRDLAAAAFRCRSFRQAGRVLSAACRARRLAFAPRSVARSCRRAARPARSTSAAPDAGMEAKTLPSEGAHHVDAIVSTMVHQPPADELHECTALGDRARKMSTHDENLRLVRVRGFH